jgi:hypothetical protein
MTRPALIAELLAAMTEAELQRVIVDAAALGGWRVAHFPPSRSHRGGHLTAGAYDAVRGWPDLVLIRDRLIVLELKSARGRVTPEQAAWLDAFTAAGIDTRTVRPADLDALIAELLAAAHDAAVDLLARYRDALERIVASGAYPEAAIAAEALAVEAPA